MVYWFKEMVSGELELELGDYVAEEHADGKRMLEIKAYQKDAREQGGLITQAQACMVLGIDDGNITRIIKDGRLSVYKHWGKRLLSADEVVEFAKLNRMNGHQGSVLKALWNHAKAEYKAAKAK